MNRTLVTVILMLAAMVLLWFVAHDWYAQRINQQQRLTNQQLQAGTNHLSWSTLKTSDLVRGFGQGWQQQHGGLHLTGPKPAVSWAFKNQIIRPRFHQELVFDWQPFNSASDQLYLLLEFSQVDDDIYYYSPYINIEPGFNQINLASLRWDVEPTEHVNRMPWSSLPALNTMVWRIINLTGSARLTDVNIRQTTVKPDLNNSPAMSHMLNNQLRHEWQSQRFDVNSQMMQRFFAVPPVAVFLIGILMLLLAILCYPGSDVSQQNKSGVYGLIAIVAVVAYAIQTPALFVLLEQQAWLTMLLFMIPVVVLFNHWKIPQRPAWVVWFLTLIAAVCMLWISDLKMTFLDDLPLYLIWALGQQVILGPLVAEYAHRKAGFSMSMAALLCGILFATLHLPNQMLMLATFIGGALWSYAWLAYRNIYANTVSHAVLALLFNQAMPVALLGTARVGLWF